jgi:uncharacterized protein YxeA
MKKAMITIEVLVSLLILLLVIATSTSSVRFFQIVLKQKQNYEDRYIVVLNIKDTLSSKICKRSFKEEGSFNGFNYEATCESVKELRSFKKDVDDEGSGNIGDYLLTLYKVNLYLHKDNLEKSYDYYVTVPKELL